MVFTFSEPLFDRFSCHYLNRQSFNLSVILWDNQEISPEGEPQAVLDERDQNLFEAHFIANELLRDALESIVHYAYVGSLELALLGEDVNDEIEGLPRVKLALMNVEASLFDPIEIDYVVYQADQ